MILNLIGLFIVIVILIVAGYILSDKEIKIPKATIRNRKDLQNELAKRGLLFSQYGQDLLKNYDKSITHNGDLGSESHTP